MDDVTISFRLPRALHSQVDAIAKRNHRTVSGQLRAWIAEAVVQDKQREIGRRIREDRAERDRWGGE